MLFDRMSKGEQSRGQWYDPGPGLAPLVTQFRYDTNGRVDQAIQPDDPLRAEAKGFLESLG